MSADDWIEVKNNKKSRRQERRNAQIQEEQKWTEILNNYPWIISPSRASRLRQILNIEGLDDKLLSPEWIDHQKNGWIYSKTIKPDDNIVILESEEQSILPVDNSYGDVVLFVRNTL